MTGDGFRRLALSMEGVTEKPHFDRTAFRRKRQFATLAPDGGSANLLLTPDEQDHWCGLSGAIRPVANKFGQRGWTVIDLAKADDDLIAAALATAWRNGG